MAKVGRFIEKRKEITIQTTPTTQYKISILDLERGPYFDIRCWLRFVEGKDYIPTKKGFCISFDTFFNQVLPKINEFCSEFCKEEAEKKQKNQNT